MGPVAMLGIWLKSGLRKHEAKKKHAHTSAVRPAAGTCESQVLRRCARRFVRVAAQAEGAGHGDAPVRPPSRTADADST